MEFKNLSPIDQEAIVHLISQRVTHDNDHAFRLEIVEGAEMSSEKWADIANKVFEGQTQGIFWNIVFGQFAIRENHLKRLGGVIDSFGSWHFGGISITRACIAGANETTWQCALNAIPK